MGKRTLSFSRTRIPCNLVLVLFFSRIVFWPDFDTRTRTRISLSLCLHKDKKKVILVLVLFFCKDTSMHFWCMEVSFVACALSGVWECVDCLLVVLKRIAWLVACFCWFRPFVQICLAAIRKRDRFRLSARRGGNMFFQLLEP